VIAVAVELGMLPDEVAEKLTREGLEELWAFFKIRNEEIERKAKER